MVWLTGETSDTVRVGVDDSHSLKLSFTGNRVFLDLPDRKMTNRVCDEVIGEIEGLLGEEVSPASMSFSNKLRYVFWNREHSPVFGDIQVLTRVEGEVISISYIALTGDIRYHSKGSLYPENQVLYSKIHQATIQLWMKKWRDSILLSREIISSVIKTIDRLQVYSSILGALGVLSGVITDTPSFFRLCLIPFLLTGILAIVKRRI